MYEFTNQSYSLDSVALRDSYIVDLHQQLSGVHRASELAAERSALLQAVAERKAQRSQGLAGRRMLGWRRSRPAVAKTA